MPDIFTNKLLNYILKGTILAGLLFLLWKQVVGHASAEDIWLQFSDHFVPSRLPWLAGVIVLMPLNWALETLKWRNLVLPFEYISFGKAYKAVLSGVALSIITPQRLGDYGGRILLVAPENNAKAIMATIVANGVQLLVLMAFGSIGLLLIVPFFITLNASAYWVLGVVLAGVIVLISLILFSGKKLISRLLQRWKFKKWQWISQPLEVFENYNNRDLLKAVFWAVLRYITYATQYYLLLCFFGITLPVWAAFAGIATIFLIQTSIPLPPVLGVLARGEIAILMWTQFEAEALSALGASYFLFIINLSIPALVGLAVILKLNIIKSLRYEKNNY
jgi:hypothetical protein